MNFRLASLDTITNGFSEEHKIGSRVYADIYRAVHNGEEIAVKKLHQFQFGGLNDKQFQNESRNLSMVSHKNVIRLIGFCYESRHKHTEHKGELVFTKTTERLPCFEYMQGGSLQQYIADGPCGLNWPTCYKIIQGTCEGLNHLHNAREKAIFHLDLKPSKILLDKNMTPKIAGLGLSRLVTSTISHQTQMLVGTVGYMPPEYIDRGIISNKFDVFSLGRIIITMMAGHIGAYRYAEMSPNQFIEHVSENWKERLQTMSASSSYETNILRVRACVEIALRCVDKDRNKRPSIKEILWELGMKTIIPLPTDHKSISFVLDSQSSFSPTPDQAPDLIETEIKKNRTDAEIKTNRTEADIKTMLSVTPDQSGLDSRLCSTTAPDYSKDQIEAKIETIMSLPSDHKSNWSGLDSESRSVIDLSKDLILQTGSKLHHLPLQYLKDITNNFCDERILGRGGFGVVYEGVLQNGKSIAVKKLLQAKPISLGQFENEVNLLMNLNHPNIVRLVGYCYETQHLPMPHEGKIFFNWITESLLCLECLPNGSLYKHISAASSGLDWATRWKIIEGISYGLQYLHEQSKNPILHLDLKPANILLDENMLPKITDFGLSRLIDQEQTIYTTNIGGTLGYMPPEYLRRIITPKSDIFSLGVIIMEIITGHRDYPENIKASSHDFIEHELQEWRNRLQKEPWYASLESDCRQIERCIQIGLLCVNPERTKRPTMKKIIDMLERLESMNWYISNELSRYDILEEP